MSERTPGFLDEVMRRCFGPAARRCPWMRRADFERLLTDDGQRRIERARHTAVEWAASDAHGAAAITSERVMVTPRGLLYAAGLATAPGGARFYLAAAPALFDPVVDRVHVSRLLPRQAAAVDGRFGADLVFAWPLDGALRRAFDTDEVLRLGR